MSSAYHPESQGALERLHQTLTSMLHAFCVETGKDWADGLPLLMFAIRKSVQESLGFSPIELVFGHTVRGLLRLLSEQLLRKSSSPVSVLEYVSSFRERLHQACTFAKTHLAGVQSKMKKRFDQKSLLRNFCAGESVLVLLPIPESMFQAKFFGPYVIEKKLSETDYVVGTPDRKRKSRVCHINVLKAYHVPDVTQTPSSSLLAAPILVNSEQDHEEDVADDFQGFGVSLENSVVLSNIDSRLEHLPPCQREDVVRVIRKYPSLFSDVPGRTTVLCHDIDVGTSLPIKQHP